MSFRFLSASVCPRIFFALFLALRIGWAGVGGSISGRVLDPHQLPIEGVTVTVVNTATNVHESAITNAAGIYLFADLPVGTYDVEVVTANFRAYRRTQLLVDVNSSQRVDIPLQLGDRKDTVTVTAAPTHVETTDTQIGEVVSGTKIAAVPLNGRSFTDLLALQPGVAPLTTITGNSIQAAGAAISRAFRRSQSGHHLHQRPAGIRQWLHSQRFRRSGTLHHGRGHHPQS